MFEDYMHGFIKEICDEIGPRESGTQEEILAGDRIEEEFKKYCNETHQESYISSPTAFLGFIRYGAAAIIVAIVFYWLSLLIDMDSLQMDASYSLFFISMAAGIAIFCDYYFIFEVMRYTEFLDRFFPKKTSKNVVGTIEPTGEVKHTIIFAGHHDSASEFNLFYHLKTVGAATIFVGFVGAIIFGIVSVIKLIFYFIPVNLTQVFFVLGIVALILVPIAVLYMFFHSYKPVLGAFDNLSAVAVTLGIGRYLVENKSNSDIYPKHTRVHLVSFAGEEAGLRGSKRYVKAHHDELTKSGTILVNMDGIGKKDEIIIANTELLIGAKHDKEVCEDLLRIAQDLNIRSEMGTLPFGASDAASFTHKKLRAGCIMAYPHKLSLPDYYHTRLDTPEVVDKEALGQVLQICLEYLKYIDTLE